jgi:hypothetical protein
VAERTASSSNLLQPKIINPHTNKKQFSLFLLLHYNSFKLKTKTKAVLRKGKEGKES